MSPSSLSFLGVFSHVDSLVAAVKKCQQNQFNVCDVYSPVPNEEIAHLVKPGRSPIRFVTLTGALAGLCSGLGLALWTSAVWELMAGGKAVYALIPFVVVGFE